MANTTTIACKPGKRVQLDCSVAGETPAVLRTCDYSAELEQGVACVYRDALSNTLLSPGSTRLEVSCPDERDADEPGGVISLYSAPLLPEDELSEISCVSANE